MEIHEKSTRLEFPKDEVLIKLQQQPRSEFHDSRDDITREAMP